MNQLKLIREKKFITQVDLAKKLGVTQGAISSWESGRNGSSMKRAFELARVLGCSVEELFAETQTDKVSPDKCAETK